MKQLISLFLLGFYISFSFAQKPTNQNPSEIYESIQKLNFLGSALYIAAHPDDENTRLISYFSNHIKARTGYLSLTRGDGGQNLIGPELRELLGVMRTQELLAARRIDGGEQFFTRANDFGYSKHPDETLAIWNKEEVLKDVVSVIRKFKPDVIINRFDHRTPGTTHGHHTSSAILSTEAFDLANKLSFQTHYGNIWQPKRLFFNTSWWFYGSEERFDEADKSNMLNFDIGVYYPMRGMSNNEIASIASSQHLCQGFGRLTTRGSQQEYIELIKGNMPKSNNPFEGIDTSWNRVKGGKAIGKLLHTVESNFNFTDPTIHLPDLLKAYQLIDALEDTHWREIKLKQLKNIISSVLGLYIEPSASSNYVVVGDSTDITTELVARAKATIVLKSIQFSNQKKPIIKNLGLTENKRERLKEKVFISTKSNYTTPYWLSHKGSLGMYNVENKALVGQPETPRGLLVDFNFEINKTPITITKPVVYRYAKPDKGELYKPFEILPPVSLKVDNKIIISKPNEAIEVNVTVKALKNNIHGYVELEMPTDWDSPMIKNIDLENKGEEKMVSFLVNSSSTTVNNLIKPKFIITNEAFTDEVVEINYDHIPAQTVLVPAQVKAVRLDIKKQGERIAYIQGAGDKIPESLRQIGYQVDELRDNEITADNLQKYDAVILGIRAYNVNENAKFYQKDLHNYVEDGGTLLVQYNTSRRQVVKKVAPYALKLSRDRVTDENSEVKILAKNHPVIHYPNKITKADFDGWVQERGLYFPNEWSDEFTPILGMQDKGETEKQGGLLIAKYGKGHFIYTGLSFFRELPAGVAGAYKLYANLLSVGKTEENESSEK